jgi:hypothetical protein
MLNGEHIWEIVDQDASELKKRVSDLHHYTSVETLLKIIKNKCLFASHLRFLNDYEEYNIGYKNMHNYLSTLIKGGPDRPPEWFLSTEFAYLPKEPPSRRMYYSGDVSKKTQINQCLGFDMFREEPFNETVRKYYLRSILPEVYVISFCDNGDSLNNWITYAKENGVSIEFDFSGYEFVDQSLAADSSLEDKIKKNRMRKGDIDNIVKFPECSPREIFYLEGESLNDYLSKIIGPLIETFQNAPDRSRKISVFWVWLSSLFVMVPFMKTSDFKNEKEIRVAFRAKGKTCDSLDSDGEKVANIINYREKNNMLIPPFLIALFIILRVSIILQYPLRVKINLAVTMKQMKSTQLVQVL